VERYRDEIQKSIPEVDAVIGTGGWNPSRSRGPHAFASRAIALQHPE